jgi:ketosteroid isomerase-like protein
VEFEPLRTELMGEVAFEAGRCKMLVPVSMGKRREERGKYLVVLIRQPGGEWKMSADSWSSDLSLAPPAESTQAKPARKV